MRRDRGGVDQGTGTTPVASPMKDVFEEVDLSGSTARNSLAVVEEESPKKETTMMMIEDLETKIRIEVAQADEMPSADIPHEVEESTASDESKPVASVLQEPRADIPSKLFSPSLPEDKEEEIFQSLPTTPLEAGH